MFDKFFDDLFSGLAQTMLDKKIKNDALGTIGQAVFVRLIRNSSSEILEKIFKEVYEEYKAAVQEQLENSLEEDPNKIREKITQAYDEAYKEIRMQIYKVYTDE